MIIVFIIVYDNSSVISCCTFTASCNCKFGCLLMSISLLLLFCYLAVNGVYAVVVVTFVNVVDR